MRPSSRQRFCRLSKSKRKVDEGGSCRCSTQRDSRRGGGHWTGVGAWADCEGATGSGRRVAPPGEPIEIAVSSTRPQRARVGDFQRTRATTHGNAFRQGCYFESGTAFLDTVLAVDRCPQVRHSDQRSESWQLGADCGTVSALSAVAALRRGRRSALHLAQDTRRESCHVDRSR